MQFLEYTLAFYYIATFKNPLRISLLCFYFHLFFFLVILFLTYYVQDFVEVSMVCSKLNYIASFLTVYTSYTPTTCTHHGHAAIVRLIMSQYIAAWCYSKWQFLTRIYVLIVLLEWVDRFNLNGKRLGGATLPFTILYCCISF